MHLDARSWYSFHDGVSSPAALCAQAAELGFETLGLCDVDGIYGLIGFYKSALKCGLRPLLGLSLTDPASKGHAVAGGVGAKPRFAPGEGAGDAGRSMASPLRDGGDYPAYLDGKKPLPPGSKGAPYGRKGDADSVPSAAATVIARDRDGYGELCRLASARRLRADFKLAEALERGTGHCYVITDQVELLRRLGPRLGPRRLFVRLAPDYGEACRARQLRQLKLAAHFRLSPVACTDVRFLRPQDQPVHHVLRAIGQNATLQTAQGVCPREHYLSAPVELGGYYYDCPQALDTARELAQGCEVDFELGKWVFPDYPLSRGESPQRALRDLCQRGLVWRYGRGGDSPAGYDQRHLSRLDYELDVIDKLGYTSYFLAVYDIVRAAGRRGIPCLGRGSAANSIVSYLLGLTPVDPIALNMYFERFLNPARQSPPDIDIDFSSKRRDEILKFVYERWGRERVAMISTHVTFRARGAFREVGKVFGLSDKEISIIARRIPHTSAEGLTTIKQDFAELRGVDLRAEPYCHIIPLASQLGGCPRHLGIHCGGVVIAPERLTDYTALQRAAKGFVVTQYEMFSVEDVGLIKIDLLGNCGLDALEDTLRSLAARGIRPPTQRLETAVQDPDTVELVREGRTMGCFYIESPGMRQLLKRLRTQTFLELTAASSVIRPGVAESGMMQEYIRRVRGQEHKLPSHPLMLKLLPETRGVMIYQEDVIRVGHELAGLSPAEADLLRRAMSGKLRSAERMNEVRERFVAGCEKNGIDTASALTIWRQIASFSGYSFCKAHSAAFASLSWKVAYLKAHHPADFMAAVLSHSGGFYGSRAYLSEAERLGLGILPPDVNYSDLEYKAEYSVGRDSVPVPMTARLAHQQDGSGPDGHGDPSHEPDAVRVGLQVIKGVGTAALERIVTARTQAGPYSSLPEFIRRARPGRGELEILIQCGALDSLKMSRPQLQWLADGEHRAGLRGGSLPLSEDERLADFSRQVGARLSDHDEQTRCNLELEHFGMLVSRHPLTLVAGQVKGVIRARELPRYVGRPVRLLGWCIATKRVDLTRRRAVRDTLALQGGDHGGPNPLAADELDEDEPRESAAAELGIIRSTSNGRPPPYHYYEHSRRALKFMSMEDLSGTFEVVLFPQAYERLAHLTVYAGPFVVSGTVEEQFDTYTVNATGLRLLTLAGDQQR